jgi:Flp pilus assembly protein TadG
MMRGSRRRLGRPGSRGSSLLEFALAAGVLVPMFFATFQFGLAFFYYNELASAVRAGARYASFRSYDSATATPSAAYLAAIRNEVVYGNPSGTGSPLVPGLSPSNVAVEMDFSDGAPSTVQVSIRNYEVDTVVRRFTLNKPSASMPYVGRWAPVGR